MISRKHALRFYCLAPLLCADIACAAELRHLVAPGETLTLVWSDEFNGTKLDPAVWFFETGDGKQWLDDQFERVGGELEELLDRIGYFAPDAKRVLVGVPVASTVSSGKSLQPEVS